MKQKSLHCRQARKIYIALILILVISGCFMLSNYVHAEEAIPELDNPLGEREVPELVGGIIQKILGLVGVLALVMFIYGGITWMTSAGAPEKIKKGRDTLVWAVLGLAFIFLSYAILNFIIDSILKAKT